MWCCNKYPGTVGTDSVFDGVTVALEHVEPSQVLQRITVTNEFKIADFNASGSPTDAVEFTNADVGSKFIIDGCDANVT